MADYSELKQNIASVIKSNNRREITGQILQNVLNQMVGSLGENYQLAGFAEPTTNPQQPDQTLFYIAEQAGVYTNFDNITLGDGLSFLMWKNSEWTSHTIGVATHSWVDSNYVSKAFLRQIFRVYDADGFEILPNDTTSIADNIKAMVGLWTNEYLSALGLGDDGQTGAQYLTQLGDVNIDSTTLADGQVLVYDNGLWVNGQAGGVDMSVVWSALAGNTNEQINASHLTTALTGYVTSSSLSTTLADYVTTTALNTALASYASQSWVSQNYVSIAFLNRILRAYDSTDTQVQPNDTTTAIDNLKAMVGLWTEQYLSALGQGNDGGGGGYITTLGQLEDVLLTTPSVGQALVYAEVESGVYKWVNGTAGVDMSSVWTALAGGTNEQIALSHLTTALSGYVTTGGLSTTLADYVTATALSTTLADYVTATSLSTTLASYVTTSALSTTLADYATTSWVSNTLSVYATQQWVGQNYISIAFFNRLFAAYDSSNVIISPNDTTTAVDNIKALVGLWTQQYLSALGQDSDGGGGGQGDVTWALLADDTDTRQIALSHLTSALTGYATQSWVGNNYLPLSGGTLSNTLHINVNNDVSASGSSGSLIIGVTGSETMGLDANEIQVRRGNTPAVLYLQNEGGSLWIGASVTQMSGNISYKGTLSTNTMITFLDNTTSSEGNGIAIGGGGLTIIGGGESAGVIAAQYISAGEEDMCVGNDRSIHFYSNLQNGWSSRKEMTFSTDGNLYIGSSKVWTAGNLTDNNQLTNGAGYITSSALSSYLPLSGGTLSNTLHINVNNDVSASGSSGSLIIGVTGSETMGIDANEIQVRNGNTAADLYLQNEGGVLYIGASMTSFKGNLAYNGTFSSKTMISFLDNGDGQDGYGIAIGGGGLTIIGGGESAGVIAAQYISAGVEDMCIGNDNSIHFYSNLQNGWNSRKEMTFSAGGTLSVDGYSVITSGNIGSQSVSYASSAGSVAWGNITNKPNLVSIASDGVSEVGQYMDFHYGSSTSDYSVRLDVTANSQVVVHLPTSSGTLALYSQIPTNNNQLTNGAGYITSSDSCAYATSAGSATYATNDSDGNAINSTYLKLSGGTLTNRLVIDLDNDATAGYPNTGSMRIGPSSGNYLLFDGNEIVASSGSSLGTLHLQYNGGNIQCGGGASVTMNLTGNFVATGGVTSLSDERDKEVLGNTTITVEQIAQMPTVLYRWNDGREDMSIHAGTLAQRWEPYLPQVVMKAPDERQTRSFAYGVAALIAATIDARKIVDHDRLLREQAAKISELENKCSFLEREVERLKCA